MIAMLLAGGQGTRLGKLTKETAKPAVPFGGRYRIIDFALSNCFNSKVYEVGVVTQYQPLELNEHIGNGRPWGLNRRDDSVRILQPYSSAEGNKWFQGTANAIYQNIDYIDSQDPEYVLILSGDHIYKMDYSKMLDFHKEKNAELTVAVLNVPIEEASRFGIMETNAEGRIVQFHEKPKNPVSTLASMGIYIFNWKQLKNTLIEDSKKEGIMMDFGKHVIPSYLNSNHDVFAYAYDGYWKDVGTIESLWETHMEFLDPDFDLKIGEEGWRIFTRYKAAPPQYIKQHAEIKNAMIVDGCIIDGYIESSILSQNVHVKKGAEIKHSVIMENAKIDEDAKVSYAIVGENARIEKGAVVIGTRENIKVVGYGEVVENENE